MRLESDTLLPIDLPLESCYLMLSGLYNTKAPTNTFTIAWKQSVAGLLSLEHATGLQAWNWPDNSHANFMQFLYAPRLKIRKINPMLAVYAVSILGAFLLETSRDKRVIVNIHICSNNGKIEKREFRMWSLSNFSSFDVLKHSRAFFKWSKQYMPSLNIREQAKFQFRTLCSWRKQVVQVTE
jgi:hypothetical protein